MTISLNKIKEKFAMGFMLLCLSWMTFALGFQLFFVYLQFSGQEKRAGRISNEITWKIDGRFKNNPDNIWYEAPKK
jgi:hypothetical protein